MAIEWDSRGERAGTCRFGGGIVSQWPTPCRSATRRTVPAGSANTLTVTVPSTEHSQRTGTLVSNLVLYLDGALQRWQQLPRELARVID